MSGGDGGAGPARAGAVHEVALGLGSNLGDRRATILAAIAALDAEPDIAVTARSRLHETDPIGPAGQGPYLNAAITLRTNRGPRELLRVTRSIEDRLGRERGREARWGPRTIDLDILLFGSRIVDEPGLTIPHPRLAERLFALIPLGEIADSWVHPSRGVTIKCLREALSDATTPPPRPAPRPSAGRQLE